MNKRRAFVPYERPSFAEGMGRILDFGNTLTPRYPISRAGRSGAIISGPDRSAAAIDREAIASDWAAVGGDIRSAVKVVTRGHAPSGQVRSKTVKAGQRAPSGASRGVGAARFGARAR